MERFLLKTWIKHSYIDVFGLHIRSTLSVDIRRWLRSVSSSRHWLILILSDWRVWPKMFRFFISFPRKPFTETFSVKGFYGKALENLKKFEAFKDHKLLTILLFSGHCLTRLFMNLWVIAHNELFTHWNFQFGSLRWFMNGLTSKFASQSVGVSEAGSYLITV